MVPTFDLDRSQIDLLINLLILTGNSFDKQQTERIVQNLATVNAIKQAITQLRRVRVHSGKSRENNFRLDVGVAGLILSQVSNRS